MVVYAEQIIFDNLLVDGVLMYSVCRILGVRSSKTRLFLSAALGSVAALLAGIFGGWVAWAAKAVTAPLMVWLAGRRYRPKKYFTALLLMLVLTFAYGGFCYLLLGWLGYETMSVIPIGLVTLAVGVLGVLFSRLFARARRTGQFAPFVYSVAVTVKGKTIRFDAYLDSGNTLTEPRSGTPVLVVDASLLRSVLADAEKSVLLRQPIDGVQGEWIECATVKGKGKIFAFRPDKIEIYSGDKPNTIFDVMLGVDFVRKIADCKALLNPKLLAEVRET